MKVQFNRQALAEALGLLISVVPSRTPKPILYCVRIAADEDGVHIFATDLEIGLNYILSEVKVDAPGEAVINADKLAAIVRESMDEVLTLTHEEGTCEIMGADSHFTIYSQDPEQFPQVPSLGGRPDIEVGLKALQEGTRQCLFATAKESSRYAINGVLWEIKGKKMALVATDGRRLARSRINLKAAPADDIVQQKLIVPAKTMLLLEKLGTDQDDGLAVRLVGSQIVIHSESVIITSNLVEGNFPKYEDIIPTDNDKRLTLPTDLVLSAVRRASLLASEESKVVGRSVHRRADRQGAGGRSRRD